MVVAGGGQSIEVYDPLMDNFSRTAGSIDAERYFSAATILANGKVLVTGGYSITTKSAPLSTTRVGFITLKNNHS